MNGVSNSALFCLVITSLTVKFASTKYQEQRQHSQLERSYNATVTAVTGRSNHPDNEFVEGFNLTLTCNVTDDGDGTVSEFRWFKNGQNVTGESRTEESWTKVMNRTDSGSYQCSAVNEAGEGPTGEAFDLAVVFPPEVPSLEVPEILEVGKVGNLTCDCPDPGHPTPSFQFFRSDDLLANSSAATFALTVDDVHDVGPYRCDVRHPYGEAGSGSRTIQVWAPVTSEFPKSDQAERPVNLEVAGLFSLNCTMVGTNLTKPDVVWLLNEAELPANFSVANSIVNGSFAFGQSQGVLSELRIADVPDDCTGRNLLTGSYVCKGDSAAGSSNQTGKQPVVVQYAPIAAESFVSEVSIDYRQNVTLSCNVCSIPEVGAYSWSPLAGSERHLEVPADNFGRYTCHASTVIDESNYTRSFDICLVQKGAPHPVSIFTSLDNETSTSISLFWKQLRSECGNCGDIQYLVEYSQGNGNTSSTTVDRDCESDFNHTLLIDDLLESRGYNFSLYSSNNCTSEYVLSNRTTTTTKSTPDVRNFRAEGRKGGIRVTWEYVASASSFSDPEVELIYWVNGDRMEAIREAARVQQIRVDHVSASSSVNLSLIVYEGVSRSRLTLATEAVVVVDHIATAIVFFVLDAIMLVVIILLVIWIWRQRKLTRN